MNALSKYKYSDAEIKTILKEMTILIDSREQKNSWITDYFKSKNIPFKNHKLDFADYSAMIPAMPEMGILRPIYFDREIVLERKAHLEELSQNLAQRRAEFSNEWLRAGDCKKLVVVENGSYSDILDGKYNTEFKAESFFASILSFENKFNLRITFCKKEHTAKFIHAQLYYHLREVLLC